MAYATIAEMIDQFGTAELAQRTNLDDAAATAINAAVLTRALDDAAAEIDGYLGRYPLPFASPPALLNKLCRAIARKNLYFDAPPSGGDKPQWRREYEDAVAMLRSISAGEIDLGSLQADAHPALVKARGNARVFTRDRLVEM